MAINDALTEVFNRSATKIVALGELTTQFKDALEDRFEAGKFSAEQLGEYIKAIKGDVIRDNVISFDHPDAHNNINKVVTGIGDGTLGFYIAFPDGIPVPAAAHMKFIEQMLYIPAVTAMGVIRDAMAEALDKCADVGEEVRVDVKRGVLQAAKPKI